MKLEGGLRSLLSRIFVDSRSLHTLTCMSLASRWSTRYDHFPGLSVSPNFGASPYDFFRHQSTG